MSPFEEFTIWIGILGSILFTLYWTQINKKLEFRSDLEPKDERPVEFPNGEPEYWYGEYDVNMKMVEIGLDQKIIRIPQETLLSWFMSEEYNKLVHEKGRSEETP